MKRILAIMIGILILFAAGCTNGKKTTSYSPDSPEGVAQAYYQAIQDGKPADAYGYLKTPWSVSKEQFIKEKSGSGMSFKGVSVEKAQISGNTATVNVKLQTGVSEMPEITRTVNLEKADSWKISSFDSIGGGTGAPAQGTNPHGDLTESGGYNPSLVNPNGPGK